MKKAFTLLSFCLALMLALTACTKGVEPVNAKEYGCVYFPGIDWGISEEELYEALGKTADDFEIIEGTDENSYLPSIELCSDDIEFMGEKREGRFIFTSFPDSDDKRLCRVVIAYDMGEQTPDEFETKVGEFIKSQNVEFTTDTLGSGNPRILTHFYSSACLSGLPQEMRDSYNGYMRDFYSNEVNENRREWLSRIDDFTVDCDGPLSQILVQYGTGSECGIFFDATTLVYAQMYIEAYEEEQNKPE